MLKNRAVHESTMKAKRSAQAAEVRSREEATAEATAGGSSLAEELEFEDEFEDEFEEEDVVDGAGEEAAEMEEAELEAAAAGGGGSSSADMPDDGLNPSIGGRFYRAGDAIEEGEELRVDAVPVPRSLQTHP